VLLETCKRIEKALRGRTEEKEFAGWSRFLGDLLQAAGWPGDQELDEQEQKIVERWNEALSELASLGMVEGTVTFERALAHLTRLLSDSLERGDWSAPVEVLEAAEAAGWECDRAIAVGLGEEDWPPRTTVAPLIPLSVQRAHGVPASSTETLRAERRKKTAALFHVAPEMVAAYSGRLSPVAGDYVNRDAHKSRIWTGQTAREAYLKAPLERVEDGQAPALAASAEVRGGASLIKAQSACPFKALAEYRMGARAPEEACFGFDARERGGFLHKALENVWRRLGSQQELRLTSVEELREIVRTAVEEAVAGEENGALHKLVTRAEQERLEGVLGEWLAVEWARKQPFTVETIEEERYFAAAGLKLRLRVDRVDRLANGHVVLIDYKSGKQTRNKLKGPRPPEPQLLVYAASTPDAVDGIFFGQIQAGDTKAIGVSREKQFESRSVDVMKGEWCGFLEESREKVERLAEQFVSGYAVVDPAPGACSYCAVKPLCRVQEAGGTEEEEC
jgi:ATP-dependent helicase/nuclease subunit B